MRFRPIVWGLIFTILGAYFWYIVWRVYEDTIGWAMHGPPTDYVALLITLMYIFEPVMLFSLPVAIVIEAYIYLKRRESETE